MGIKQSRRAFLESAGFGGSALMGSSWLAAARAAEENPAPDLIVINAKVTTMDGAMPRAEAFAVRGDKFLAVGSTTDIKALAGAKTRTYDAKGMLVLPTFEDTHNHGFGETLLYDVVVGNPYDIEYVTIQSIIDKLKARAAKTPPGYWVEGQFYDDGKSKDNRPLNIHDLDKVSTVHPVMVMHRGHHSSFYNSKAMEMAGITKNTPSHFGGTFDKDAKGELNGRVTDRAREVFTKAGKHVTYSPAEEARRKLAGVEFISRKFVEYGIANVCHNEEGALEAMQVARQRGNLLHRVSYEVSGDLLEAMIKTGIKTGFGDEWIKFGATTEHGVDGSFSERTAAISRPFIGISPPYTGNVTERQEDSNAWAERVHRAGIRLNCHANGDRAIAQVLTAYEHALKVYPVADSRPKITHCTFINDDIIRRMKAMDAVPAEFSTYAYYNADKFKYYGADFMAHAMAYRTFADAGIRASTGSDFPAGTFQPMMAIQGMVTRKGFNGEIWGANQKVTVDEAIRASTYNGAYNTREEKIKGSITAGKFADWVVLSDDLHAIDPEKILNVKVVQTVVGGKTVYQA